MSTNIEKRLATIFEEHLSKPESANEKFNNTKWELEIVSWYDRHLKRSPYRWDNFRRAVFAMRMLQKIYECYGLELVSGNLIDIGCGSGATLAKIEEILDNGFLRGLDLSLWGIDFSKEGIEVAKQRTNSSRFIVGEFSDYQFAEKFDYVLSIGVFEHFPQPVEAFRKTHDILKPDGLAYVSVPVLDDYFEIYDSDMQESFARHRTGTQLSWMLNKSTWREIIDASGLVVIKELPNINIHSMNRWVLARHNSYWTNTHVSFWKLDRVFYSARVVNYLLPFAKKIKNIFPKRVRSYVRNMLSAVNLINKA